MEENMIVYIIALCAVSNLIAGFVMGKIHERGRVEQTDPERYDSCSG